MSHWMTDILTRIDRRRYLGSGIVEIKTGDIIAYLQELRQVCTYLDGGSFLFFGSSHQ